MCGRYIYFDGKKHRIAEILEKTKTEEPDLYNQLTLFDVRPQDTVLSMLFDHRNNRILLTPMTWGFSRNKSLSINARIETLCNTSLYDDTHPCVLMCSAFYEFDARHQPYLLKNEEELYMAGLCRRMDNRLLFLIVTQPAQLPVRLIHDRQPVLLNRQQAFEYCSCASASAYLNKYCANIEVTMTPMHQKRAAQLPLF